MDGWVVGSVLYLPIGFFGVAISLRVLVIGPDKSGGPKKCLSDPYLPFSALCGPHCLSCDFMWLAKPTLEKQTSQLSLVMQQCTGS